MDDSRCRSAHRSHAGPLQGHQIMLDHVGQPATAFELTDLNGQLHKLSDYKGSWLLLVFHRHLG